MLVAQRDFGLQALSYVRATLPRVNRHMVVQCLLVHFYVGKNCQRPPLVDMAQIASVALYRLIEYDDLRRHSPQRYNRSVLFTSTVLSYLQTR